MIGETFGNYRLVRRLGAGAMGTVFLGEHERIVRSAAVKVLASQFAEDADILRRFFDEARATSLIRHPAIVEVLDCGVHADGRRPYIAMEYLEGETLAARLERSGPLSWQEACATARQLAHALDAAHCHRIVHRDVKPANIMLIAGPNGAPQTSPVKLLDFGVAKLVLDTQSRARTSPGQLLGTPEYMAPEQCGGEGSVDGRTDIYALGCVLFEMICRRPPFFARRLSELIVAHQWREPPAASAYATLPPSLDGLIARMLSKRPADRPADMASVSEALGRVLESAGAVAEKTTTAEGAQPAAQPAETPPARRTAGIPATASLVLAAGFLAIAVLSVGLTIGLRGRKPPYRGPAVSASVVPQVAAVRVVTPPVAVRAAPAPAIAVQPAPATPAPVEASPATRSERRAPAPRRAPSRPSPKVDSDGIVDL